MSTYLILVLCAAAAAFALFIVLNVLRQDRRGVAAAAFSLPLCAALGFLFAKAGYVLLTGEWDALLTPEPSEYCFTCGAAGVCLGVLFASRITGHRPAGKLADRFVLPGTLLAAGLRMAEIELGSLGAGRYIDIPAGSAALVLAVWNRYGEPHVAVFVWEALAALAVGLLSLREGEIRPGQRFESALFRLCACQVLLENMRNRAISWGFVRVEQLLCAVILMALLLCACARREKKQGVRRFLPALYLLVCIAAIVGIEFIRQRSPSRFMGEHGGFLMMGAVLCVILLLYRFTVKGRLLHRPPENPETNR
jgi:hypothetical protein